MIEDISIVPEISLALTFQASPLTTDEKDYDCYLIVLSLLELCKYRIIQCVFTYF